MESLAGAVLGGCTRSCLHIDSSSNPVSLFSSGVLCMISIASLIFLFVVLTSEPTTPQTSEEEDMS